MSPVRENAVNLFCGTRRESRLACAAAFGGAKTERDRLVDGCPVDAEERKDNTTKWGQRRHQ